MKTLKSLHYWLLLKFHRMRKDGYCSFKGVKGCLLIAVLLSLMFFILLLQDTRVAVATVDEKKLFASFVTALGKKDLTDARMEKITGHFTDTYKKTLLTHAQKNRLVIIKREQALASANDITDIIAAEINRDMEKHA